jgi:hypothetical protein|tara:strand:- start:2281 stop:2511 length:231 start_codon:yes stop_codon:yes gene_type:complete
MTLSKGKEIVSKSARAPDRRPAIAFDEKSEVQAVLDALNAYRYEHIDRNNNKLDEYYRKLIDVIEDCIKLFDKEKG